jgi:hypothetical protein
MAHFAYVVEGIVKRVHVVNNEVITDSEGVEQGSLGKEFLSNLYDYGLDEVIQCSYNGTVRGAYPGQKWRYDSDSDTFLPPEKPDTDSVEV